MLSQIKKFIIEHKYLILLLLFAISFRVFTLDNIIFDDESTFYDHAVQKTWGTHPPISFWLFQSFLVDNFSWSIRLMPFIFGIFNLILVYMLGKLLFDKRSALFSVFLMSFSFWHVLASSMIDINGNIILFEYLILIIFLVKYFKTEKNSYLVAVGIVLGLTVMTKYVDAVILVALFLGLIVLKYRFNIWKMIKTVSVPGFVSVFVFLLFVFYFYVSGNWENFLSTLGHTGGSWDFTLRPVIYLIFWATPLLSGLFLISFKKISLKKMYIPLAWIFTVLFFYFFVSAGRSYPFGRYLMTIIPPLCLIGGVFLSKYDFKSRILVFLGIILTVVFYFVNIFLLNLKVFFVPNNFGKYFQNIIILKLNFLFPYTGSSGPSFWISFGSMFFVAFFSFVLILLYFLFNKSQVSRTIIIIFLALNLGFNLFLIQEHSFSLMHPDITKINYQIIDYYDENPEISRDVLLNGYASSLSLYIPMDFIVLKEENLNKIDSSKEYTLILVDFPIIDPNSFRWKFAKQCDLLQKFSDKNINVGYIFTCRAL